MFEVDDRLFGLKGFGLSACGFVSGYKEWKCLYVERVKNFRLKVSAVSLKVVYLHL